MEIPVKCQNCNEVQGLMTEPVVSFSERLEAIAGKAVQVINKDIDGGYAVGQVQFIDGTIASEEDVRLANDSHERDLVAYNARIEEYVEGCPGLKEATLRLPNGKTTILPMCGRVALNLFE